MSAAGITITIRTTDGTTRVEEAVRGHHFRETDIRERPGSTPSRPAPVQISGAAAISVVRNKANNRGRSRDNSKASGLMTGSSEIKLLQTEAYTSRLACALIRCLPCID